MARSPGADAATPPERTDQGLTVAADGSHLADAATSATATCSAVTPSHRSRHAWVCADLGAPPGSSVLPAAACAADERVIAS